MHWKWEGFPGFSFINQTLKQVKYTQNWNLHYHGILQEGGVPHAEDMEKFMNGERAPQLAKWWSLSYLHRGSKLIGEMYFCF